jgi:putative transposase
MATPRALLVDPDQALNYHLVSRCVRRSWLCGWDKSQGKDFSHRKSALQARLFRLVRCFAVELYGFAVMSNHFHLVVRFDFSAFAAQFYNYFELYGYSTDELAKASV